MGCGARSELPGAGPSDANRPDAAVSECAALRTQQCAAPWSFGEPATLQFDLAVQPRLRALAGDCTGAWLLVDAVSRSARQPVTVIARLDAQGRTGNRVWVGVPAVGESTLAVDFVSGRAAAMATGGEGNGYRFLRLDHPEFPNNAFVPINAGTGFSLGGCRHGMASPGGWSFVAEQIRALWGLERVALGIDGTFRDRVMLRVPEELGLTGMAVYERVAFDDGAYTMLWLDRAARSRQALYYDSAEQPGTVRSLRATTVDANILGAIATDDGLVDVYAMSATDNAARFAFFDRTGTQRRREVTRPASLATTLRGFSMAFTRATLLSVAAGGSGVPMLESVSYTNADNALAVQAPLRLASPMVDSRAAAVAGGALVVWVDSANELHSVRLGCE